MINAKRSLQFLAAGLVLATAMSASADARRRWFLDFELGVPREIVVLPPKPGADAPDRTYVHSKPELFQYRDRLGNTTLVWFVPFTLKNPSTDQYVPLTVDVMLRTERGKDYHQDILRSDPGVPPRGRYYSSVIQSPDIELRIVSRIEKLGNRNEEMQRERLMELKRQNRYLNPAELRRKQVLNPGEEVVGLAIFRDVDRQADTLELTVDGLVDVARIVKIDRERTHYVYENRVLHLYFDMPGDEFGLASDFVSCTFPKSRKWEVHQVGPAADKSVLPKLIDALAAQDPEVDPAVKKILAVAEYGPDVRRGAHAALTRLSGMNLPFDAAKPPDDPVNLETIRLYREWWTRNSEKLVYNDVINRFEVKPQVIPGSVEVRPPYAK